MWELFGVGYRDWDDLLLADFEWMHLAADEHERALRAEREANRG